MHWLNYGFALIIFLTYSLKNVFYFSNSSGYPFSIWFLYTTKLLFLFFEQFDLDRNTKLHKCPFIELENFVALPINLSVLTGSTRLPFRVGEFETWKLCL